MAGQSATIQWSVPPEALARNVGDYVTRMLGAVHDLCVFFAAKIEAHAKQAAPWTDRTGIARQGLTGKAVKTATGVILYLFHQASYGIWLEVKNAGRFAVILRSLEAHYSPLMDAIRRLLR